MILLIVVNIPSWGLRMEIMVCVVLLIIYI